MAPVRLAQPESCGHRLFKIEIPGRLPQSDLQGIKTPTISYCNGYPTTKCFKWLAFAPPALLYRRSSTVPEARREPHAGASQNGGMPLR